MSAVVEEPVIAAAAEESKRTDDVPSSWRDFIRVEPVAANMPTTSSEDFEQMVADISKHGIQNEIDIYRDPDGNEVLWDGCTRLDAAEKAGLPIIKDGALNFDVVPHRYVPAGTDPKAYIHRQNFLRRHLNAEQKRDAIGRLLQENPKRSDRDIGREIGVDNKTVANVRRQKESREEIPHTETRKDKDGRVQAAHKPKHATNGTPDEAGEELTEAPASPADLPATPVSGNGAEAPASTPDDTAPTPTDPSKLSAKIWRAATSAADEAVKTEIMQGEDLETILSRLSEAQKERLFDRLVAHQIRQAKVMSKSVDDMLRSITGTFWHMASQDDPAKVVEAMVIIKGKLAKRQLSAKDIKFAVAKRERVISPAAMAAAQAAQEKIGQRRKHH
jgi:hypothetical protein